MSRPKSGGGETMNKNVRPGVRWGKDTLNKVSPAGTYMLGSAMDPKAVKPLFEGKAKDYVELGNKLALNVNGGGPGVGREVFRAGSQGTHGQVRQGEMNMAPDPSATGTKGRDILGMYGKDYRK